MFDFVIYLGKSALCLVALYLIYKVSMSRETLHRLNRCLLLGSLPLSALLPLCRIKVVKEYTPAPTATTIEFNDVVLAEAGIDHLALLRVMAVGLFVVGVVVMVVRLVLSLCSVWRLTRSGSRSTLSKGVTLTVVERIPSPFSWFGHIVASEEDLQQCRQMILAHEMAHIRLGHSWDVLMVDVALCLWWFNPALWLLRRELQSLHEYQADDAVLKEGIDAKTYQMLLIKRAVGSRLHSVANCLNHSNLKKRITMMCKKTSSRWSAAKALLVLPMVALSLTAFATTVYVPREVQDKVTEISANQQPSVQTDQTNKVDKMPTFQGGGLEKFSLWIQSNVTYPAEAVAKGIEGRVLFKFVVEKDGSLSSFEVVQSPDKLLSDEVERVFNSAPHEWTPGEVAGEKVKVNFMLPVAFSMQGKASTPVLIVDGERRPYEELNQITPESIELMSVIKDHKQLSPSLGITEAEAANGVVLVLLKGENEICKTIDINVEELGDNKTKIAFVVDGKSLRVEELQPLFEGLNGTVDRLIVNAPANTPAGAISKIHEVARAAGILKISYPSMRFQ